MTGPAVEGIEAPVSPVSIRRTCWSSSGVTWNGTWMIFSR